MNFLINKYETIAISKQNSPRLNRIFFTIMCKVNYEFFFVFKNIFLNY